MIGILCLLVHTNCYCIFVEAIFRVNPGDPQNRLEILAFNTQQRHRGIPRMNQMHFLLIRSDPKVSDA